VSEFAVVLAPGAENDIASAFHWYQERSPAAASAFRAEVFEAIDLCSAEMPSVRPET
jgi:plasmid stabilization system protein ParE